MLSCLWQKLRYGACKCALSSAGFANSQAAVNILRQLHWGQQAVNYAVHAVLRLLFVLQRTAGTQVAIDSQSISNEVAFFHACGAWREGCQGLQVMQP